MSLQRTVLLSRVFSVGIKLRSRDVTGQLSVDPSSVLGLVFLGQSVSNTLSSTGDSLSECPRGHAKLLFNTVAKNGVGCCAD